MTTTTTQPVVNGFAQSRSYNNRNERGGQRDDRRDDRRPNYSNQPRRDDRRPNYSNQPRRDGQQGGHQSIASKILSIITNKLLRAANAIGMPNEPRGIMFFHTSTSNSMHYRYKPPYIDDVICLTQEQERHILEYLGLTDRQPANEPDEQQTEDIPFEEPTPDQRWDND